MQNPNVTDNETCTPIDTDINETPMDADAARECGEATPLSDESTDTGAGFDSGAYSEPQDSASDGKAADIILPSSIEPNSVVSREAPPNTTVSLNSQRLREKLPEVTGTSRGNPEFPEVTRERLGESFFNVS